MAAPQHVAAGAAPSAARPKALLHERLATQSAKGPSATDKESVHAPILEAATGHTSTEEVKPEPEPKYVLAKTYSSRETAIWWVPLSTTIDYVTAMIRDVYKRLFCMAPDPPPDELL